MHGVMHDRTREPVGQENIKALTNDIAAANASTLFSIIYGDDRFLT
jgi:hypothetical protein